jgi:aminoglycoside phosphotransferase (APT) family kinase protein
MGHLEDAVRRRPDRERLRELAAELVAGGRLAGVHALKGGISQGMHRLEVAAPGGERRQFVLRRFNDRTIEHDPTVAGREWRVLEALEGSAVPAPWPVWLDQAGRLFGRPALVTTLLPGKGTLVPQGARRWVQQLAQTLAAIHAVPITGTSLEELKNTDAGRASRLASDPPREDLQGHVRAREVWSAMRELWPGVVRDGPVLVHGDYWAGNTLWRRGRLTGVVDWEGVGLASRASDVAYTHMDLALCAGGSLPDEFVEAYERAASWTMRDRAFWRLLAVWRALGDWWEWLPGWRAFGPTDLTTETVGARVNAYVESALREAHAVGGR